jgi:hypothetical protein
MLAAAMSLFGLLFTTLEGKVGVVGGVLMAIMLVTFVINQAIGQDMLSACLFVFHSDYVDNPPLHTIEVTNDPVLTPIGITANFRVPRNTGQE